MRKKKIVIKGTQYTVIFDDNYTENYGDGSDGHIKYEEKEIVIDNKLSTKRKKIALLHEAVHAVSYECSIYQSLPSAVEEIFADCIAVEFVRLFF